MNIYSFDINGDPRALQVPLALAGGSRRIKIAENNQVTPLNRIYGTFNYFRNAIQAVGADQVGTVNSVASESVYQYTFGVEKTLFDDLVSVDLRMPFTGGINQQVASGDPVDPFDPFSSFDLETGSVGNLSTTLKALLLTR